MGCNNFVSAENAFEANQWFVIFASIFSVLSWVPQIIQLLKTRTSDDISIGWLLFGCLSSILFLLYVAFVPAYSKDIFLYVPSSFHLLLRIFIIFLVLKFRTQNVLKQKFSTDPFPNAIDKKNNERVRI